MARAIAPEFRVHRDQGGIDHDMILDRRARHRAHRFRLRIELLELGQAIQHAALLRVLA